MARLLSELAAAPSYLSSEEIAAARLRVLLEKVQRLRTQLGRQESVRPATTGTAAG